MIHWLWKGLVLRAYTKLVDDSLIGMKFLKESADQEHGEGTFASIMGIWIGVIAIFSLIIVMICC